MLSTTTVSLVGLMLPLLASATSYNLTKQYIGSTFFDDWSFYGKFDNLTNGDAIFVTKSVASSAQLAYVDSTTNHAIIKVDNTSTVSDTAKRNTVRIASTDSFEVGSMWVADMLHVPYGCSVWPAWWSQAPNWPTGGEIDTFEAVNQDILSQMSLHTEPGCTQSSPLQISTLVNTTDCSFQANDNEGCTVTNSNPASYGEAFAAAGGGVWATEFSESGISIWFFNRTSVPPSLTSSTSTIDSSTFGTPMANWPTGGCDVATFFQPQNLIFDITLCGDFAGNAVTFAETCSGNCYSDYVLGDGANYATAYFEVQYVSVFSVSGTDTVVVGTSGAVPRGLSGMWGLGLGLGAVVGVVLGLL